MCDDDYTRAELLRYYNSQSTAHAGYLISWTVAFFTLVQLFVGEKAPLWIGMMAHGTDIALVIRYVVFSTFLASGVHLVGRTLFWGALTNSVLNAEFESSETSKDTAFFKLHSSTLRKLLREKSTTYSVAKRFQSFNKPLVSGSFFIFLSVFLFYEFILKHLDSYWLTWIIVTGICLILAVLLTYRGVTTYTHAQ